MEHDDRGVGRAAHRGAAGDRRQTGVRPGQVTGERRALVGNIGKLDQRPADALPAPSQKPQAMANLTIRNSLTTVGFSR